MERRQRKCQMGFPLVRRWAAVVSLSLAVTLVGTALPSVPLLEIGRAVAQERSGLPNPFGPILDLFGLRDPPRNQQPSRQRERRTSPRQDGASVGSIRTPAPEEIPELVEQPKEAGARVVLVAGDTHAFALADGLRHAFASNPTIRIVTLDARVTEPADAAVNETSLADTASDEPKAPITGHTEVLENTNVATTAPIDETLPSQLERRMGDGDVALVVIMDAVPDEETLAVLADRAAHRASPQIRDLRTRIALEAAAVRNSRRALVWVGLPPPQAVWRANGTRTFNSLVQDQVIPVDGVFVDLWERFSDENDGYVAYGPDVNGVQRRLRQTDGIGLTWHGYRKVAFFVRRNIERILGKTGALAFDGVLDDANFIVLSGRSFSPETQLAGARGHDPAPLQGSPRHDILIEGLPPRVVRGRADDPFLPPGSQ